MAVDAFFGHDFNEAGVRIAGLVNVDIDQLIVFFGQFKDCFHIADAIFSGVFDVRCSANNVNAHADRLFQQSQVGRIGIDPVLRKRNYLNIYEIPYFFF